MPEAGCCLLIESLHLPCLLGCRLSIITCGTSQHLFHTESQSPCKLSILQNPYMEFPFRSLQRSLQKQHQSSPTHGLSDLVNFALGVTCWRSQVWKGAAVVSGKQNASRQAERMLCSDKHPILTDSWHGPHLALNGMYLACIQSMISQKDSACLRCGSHIPVTYFWV